MKYIFLSTGLQKLSKWVKWTYFLIYRIIFFCKGIHLHYFVIPQYTKQFWIDILNKLKAIFRIMSALKIIQSRTHSQSKSVCNNIYKRHNDLSVIFFEDYFFRKKIKSITPYFYVPWNEKRHNKKNAVTIHPPCIIIEVKWKMNLF